MVRLYTIDLPDADAGQPQDRIGSQVRQSGLIDGGGTATEQIATENVDLTVQGQWRYGKRFAKKAARELESLAAGGYGSLPLFDVTSDELGRKTGYYEIGNVDVSPAHVESEDVLEFTVGLNESGTRESHWRAVRTSIEDANTGLSDGSDAPIGISAQARKVRWFDSQEGLENATVSETVNAEFGGVELYDPTEASFDNPTLIYELDFEREGRVDAKVWDNRNRDKFWTFEDSENNTVDVNQWSHVFNTSWEFDGWPVVDNGLLRIEFDESQGNINVEEWDNDTESWDEIAVPQGDYELIDADIEKIGPSDVRIYTEWYEAVEDRLEQVVISIQRGLDRAVLRYPQGTTQTINLEDVLEPFVGEYATDPKPTQKLKARSEVKG